ncbi:MAG TPA: RAMP superfamily CRISPR-associated protein, partial [Blastocatellia bacterium]|nr:RAMP superfamily CRISPR-associated protein [Blastocatellia bacterium]
EYYIPGTSIAGALRAWLETGLDDKKPKDHEKIKEIRRVWGYQESDKKKVLENEQSDKKEDEHASFVLVEDASIAVPPGKSIAVEIRDGVGIDRVTGAAANQIKYDRAVMPRGTQFSFTIFVELDKDREKTARAQIDAVIEALQGGLIRFGASKSRGLGRVEVKVLAVREQGLLRKNGLLKTLRGESELPEASQTKFELASRPRLTFEIGWRPRGSLMVKAEYDGLAVNMLPLISAIDAMQGDFSFILPGSSIKGALRSQAERIVRTLLDFKDLAPVVEKQDFINQLAVKKTQLELPSLIGWLFGVAGEAEKEKESDDSNEQYGSRSPSPGLSAVTLDDCYAELKFNAEQWANVEKAKDENGLRGALDQANLHKAQQSFHVAIDRWLGSAADGFLYSVLESHGVEWEAICLTLDLSRLPDDVSRKQALMCVLLVLRDFAAGRIPLGHGTNRGMGAVEMTSLKVTTRDCETPAWLKGAGDISFAGGKLTIPPALRDELNKNWLNSKSGGQIS